MYLEEIQQIIYGIKWITYCFILYSFLILSVATIKSRNDNNFRRVKGFVHLPLAKCDVTKIKICELIGFVQIILDIKTKYVYLIKIRMLVQIVSELLPQLCSNDSIQILLKMSCS